MHSAFRSPGRAGRAEYEHFPVESEDTRLYAFEQDERVPVLSQVQGTFVDQSIAVVITTVWHLGGIADEQQLPLRGHGRGPERHGSGRTLQADVVARIRVDRRDPDTRLQGEVDGQPADFTVDDFASLLLCFTISFDEFIMAFFLAGTDPTLPIYIWSQLRFPQRLPSVLALGACILVISFFVVFFSHWLHRRGMAEGTRAGI